MTGAESAELLNQIRDEIFHAKTLVRATRNHTKTQATALNDCEERLDSLIDRLALINTPIPTPTEAQEHEHTILTRT